MAITVRFHRADRGSIPRKGGFYFFLNYLCFFFYLFVFKSLYDIVHDLNILVHLFFFVALDSAKADLVEVSVLVVFFIFYLNIGLKTVQKKKNF